MGQSLGIKAGPWLVAAAAAALMVSACGGGGGAGGPAPTPEPATPPPPALSARAQLGELIFNDSSLSGSGKLSCASCHDPAFAHGPPNGLATQIGGAGMDRLGLRAAPSLRYLERLPAFNGNANSRAEDLLGGLMADGRADTLAAQARLPWFNPREMDNGDPAALARRLRATPYAAQFATAFGGPASDDATWLNQASQALQALQLEDRRFHPYDAKVDLVLAGRVQFSNAEFRGLQAFSDPARGNCASCHPAAVTGGNNPVFTTFGYSALGVPRNPRLPANADPAYADLGLCGPFRQDLAQRQDLCGLFRIPGLRNVAERQVFFHNGGFSSLADVLSFYNTRDSDPGRWYPMSATGPRLYDDLPASAHGNVNQLAPFGPKARISEQDLADMLCFLRTLSDGYQPGSQPRPECRG